MRTNSGLGSTSYAIITAIAALVAATGGDEGYGWPFILGHFLVAWILIAAFAHLGKTIFRRP
ncbi:hypothetical protein EWH08_15865 [Sphingobium indicum]|uniref:Uncharacterized protein n=3 Tax=Sphingobium indicum TaxID=332055 RepID=A0A1L5BT22_SPHIB|nr:hypothetical protein [Sphingobium indicum]APL96015.1 hypothetical protein SIDU_16700 [Sphingobium indicum B90A]KEZ00085.1 hypothetical protein AI27_14530 [Sphingomonas sp. BHC-A]NYI24224.1 hypothetical protein [Sphingobium indicum]RYL99070.1 hypothetical protein EWH08_15865 [Sphingobium indicum]